MDAGTTIVVVTGIICATVILCTLANLTLEYKLKVEEAKLEREEEEGMEE